MEKSLKFGVVVLLLASMFTLPKDFQDLSRFLLIALFGILAYCSHLEANIKALGLYIVLIILYQPFVVLPLSPLVWKITGGLISALILFAVFKPITKVDKAV